MADRVSAKAGRNLPLAVISALALVAALASSLIFSKLAFVLLLCAFATVAVWEFCRAVKNGHFYVPFLPLSLGLVGVCLNTYQYGELGALAALFLCALLVSLVRILEVHDRHPRQIRRDFSAIFLATAYIGSLTSFYVLLLNLKYGAAYVALTVLISSGSDTGGWIFGILLGKHPMAPTISPKKSWEGFGGSIFGSGLVATVAAIFIPNLYWPLAIVMTLTAPIAATMGDLAESLLKRDLGIKDMGSVFPGHGGVLDRVDSMLFVAPLMYFLISTFTH